MTCSVHRSRIVWLMFLMLNLKNDQKTPKRNRRSRIRPLLGFSYKHSSAVAIFSILKLDTFHHSIMLFFIISFKPFLVHERIMLLLMPFAMIYGTTVPIGMTNLNMNMGSWFINHYPWMKTGFMSPLVATVNMNLPRRGNVAKRGSKQNGLIFQIFFLRIPHPIHLPLVFL